MSGERIIWATRKDVWAALNNVDVLKACIPGCESLEKLSDNEMKATAAIKLGPISARFTGKVLLSDLDPPNGYRIAGEGQGGVAGFAKGGAVVMLSDQADGTRLAYDVKAQIGGKMAQLGARLIDSTAKQMADSFFDKFAGIVATPQSSITDVPSEAEVDVIQPTFPSNVSKAALKGGFSSTKVVAIAVGVLAIVILAYNFLH